MSPVGVGKTNAGCYGLPTKQIIHPEAYSP